MCLAIPALIQSIEGTIAQADIGGISRPVSILLTPDVNVGDYVLIHTGYAISVLDQEEAHETLKLLEEMARYEEEREIH
ncbi:MAG: HypC/HybG/HupF family hydrogenase formation chaperone [Dehalococcoidia bacterium]|nr:HypC/HybG/HupF family hydrogenase formation chaperone [Dehalococcoidia bacterium]